MNGCRYLRRSNIRFLVLHNWCAQSLLLSRIRRLAPVFAQIRRLYREQLFCGSGCPKQAAGVDVNLPLPTTTVDIAGGRIRLRRSFATSDSRSLDWFGPKASCSRIGSSLPEVARRRRGGASERATISCDKQKALLRWRYCRSAGFRPYERGAPPSFNVNCLFNAGWRSRTSPPPGFEA